MTGSEYVSSLKTLAGLAAGMGAVVPAFSSWLAREPPSIAGSGAIIGAFGLLGLFLAYGFRSEEREDVRSLKRWGLFALSLSVALLLAYAALLEWTTVPNPQDAGTRFQTGFGVAAWGLTETAQEFVRDANRADITPMELMLSLGGFGEGGPRLIWKTGSILGAGTSLVLTLLASAILWCFGWGLLAKSKWIDRERKQVEAMDRGGA